MHGQNFAFDVVEAIENGTPTRVRDRWVMLQTEIPAVLRLSYFVFYSVFPKYLGLYKRYLHEILFQESAFVETPTYKFLYKLVNNYGRKWPKDKIMKIN